MNFCPALPVAPKIPSGSFFIAHHVPLNIYPSDRKFFVLTLSNDKSSFQVIQFFMWMQEIVVSIMKIPNPKNQFPKNHIVFGILPLGFGAWNFIIGQVFDTYPLPPYSLFFLFI